MMKGRRFHKIWKGTVAYSANKMHPRSYTYHRQHLRGLFLANLAYERLLALDIDPTWDNLVTVYEQLLREEGS